MGMTVAPIAYGHEKVNEINVCEALRTVLGTQKMAVSWSLLSLSMRESADSHNSVVTVATTLESIMHRFKF